MKAHYSKQNSAYYLQPKYFDKFKCIGGSCSVSCCEHWRISWTREEVENLSGRECSDELKELIGKSFIFPLKDMKNGWVGLKEDLDCPFHNEDGLCMIQKELGEECLSNTCKTYPRRVYCHNDTLMMACYCSCPAVLDILQSEPDALNLEKREIEGKLLKNLKLSVNDIDTLEKLEKNPALKYRIEIARFYNKVITCHDISLETAVVFGALASKHFSEAAEKGKVDEIPKIIAEYEEKINDKAFIKSIDEIKPNREVQFKLLNNLIFTYYNSERSGVNYNISNLHDGEKVIPENYAEGMRKLEEAFREKDYFFKNIAANTLFEQGIPFRKADASIMENYCFFALSISMMKLIVISTALGAENVEPKVKRAIAMTSRAIEHNKNILENAINGMKEKGYVSAAHIALLIK